MNTPLVQRVWRRSWVSGLALVSVLVPLVLIGVSPEVAVVGEVATQMKERSGIALLLLGLLGAGVVVWSGRALTPAWLRQVSLILASGAVLGNIYLLWSWVGLCGAQVFWDRCVP